MRRIDLLINQSRRATDNVEFSDSTGISDEEFLQYVNDAQDQLQSLISVQFTDIFQVEKIVDALVRQEEYAIPDDAFLGNRIDLLEYSQTGRAGDYYVVQKGSNRERISGVYSSPSFYIRRSGSILLQPAPQSSGKIRILYQKTLPRIDLRRAVVSSVVLTGSAITALVLDSTQQIDQTELLEEGYCTVVDKNGIVKMRRIPVTGIDTITGVVTVDAGFLFGSGETIAAGDYVLRGKESTTNSQLADNCERYLISYMNWKILKRDSSNDSSEAAQELSGLAADIVQGFKEPDGGVNLVPMLDSQYHPEED